MHYTILLICVYKAYGLFIYNIDTNHYIGMSTDHSWATLESHPDNAVNFQIQPLNVLEKLCFISKGNNIVLDVSQGRIKNRVGYWKKHTKSNQLFEFIDAQTSLPVFPKDITVFNEYRIMVQRKCLYIAEPKTEKYELFAGDCKTHKLRSTFKLTLDRYLNQHASKNASIIHHNMLDSYARNHLLNHAHIMSGVNHAHILPDADPLLFSKTLSSDLKNHLVANHTLSDVDSLILSKTLPLDLNNNLINHSSIFPETDPLLTSKELSYELDSYSYPYGYYQNLSSKLGDLSTRLGQNILPSL